MPKPELLVYLYSDVERLQANIHKRGRSYVEMEGDQPSEIEAPTPATRGNKSPSILDGAQPQGLNPQLDPKKTFQNFIEGDSNKLPRTVGLSIAEHPGKTTFNPFFIYGPSGCGKTHLINAIGVKAKETYPNKLPASSRYSLLTPCGRILPTTLSTSTRALMC